MLCLEALPRLRPRGCLQGACFSRPAAQRARLCTKMIINAGMHEVVYNMDYPVNDTSFNLLKEAGITCRKLKLP